MLNRLLCRATPWACACLLAAPAVWAVELPPAEAVRPPAAPFDRYQGWRDTPPADWREANERVGAREGSHAGMHEAQPEDGAEHGPNGTGSHHHH